VVRRVARAAFDADSKSVVTLVGDSTDAPGSYSGSARYGAATKPFEMRSEQPSLLPRMAFTVILIIWALAHFPGWLT
jgi:hypothetical protein